MEAGHTPARFQIKRMQLNMFQYILKLNENSLLFRMLMAQKEKPVKNDFYSSVSLSLIEVDIQKSENKIKVMKKVNLKI